MDYLMMKARYGSFERPVHLPYEVALEKATASYKDETLRIILPKSTDIKKKEIKIQLTKP